MIWSMRRMVAGLSFFGQTFSRHDSVRFSVDEFEPKPSDQSITTFRRPEFLPLDAGESLRSNVAVLDAERGHDRRERGIEIVGFQRFREQVGGLGVHECSMVTLILW